MRHSMKSRLFPIAGLVLAGVVLSGCNGFTRPMIPPQDNLHGRSIVLSGLPLPTVFVGSAVQWDENYAVTAAHTPLVKKVVHRCSTGCDLLFVKRKAKGPVPEWRDSVPGEKVITAGSSIAYIPIYGVGKASSTRVKINNQNEINGLMAHSAPIASGMSGGPVYGADGKVLGMTLGKGKNMKFWGEHGEHSIAHQPRVSLFIPYEDIKAEWEIFQRIQKGENIPLIKRPGRALTPEEFAKAEEKAVEKMNKKLKRKEASVKK